MFSLFNFSSIFFQGVQLTPFAAMCGRPWLWTSLYSVRANFLSCGFGGRQTVLWIRVHSRAILSPRVPICSASAGTRSLALASTPLDRRRRLLKSRPRTSCQRHRSQLLWRLVGKGARASGQLIPPRRVKEIPFRSKKSFITGSGSGIVSLSYWTIWQLT